MLQPARIVTIALGLVSLNAGLVIWSVVDHYAIAETRQTTALSLGEPSGSEITREENTAAIAMQPPTHQQLLDSVPPPTPEQLPAVAPPANLEADAGFQQFLRQAAEVVPQLADSPLLNAKATPEETAHPSHMQLGTKQLGMSHAYQAIESRLQIVSQLNAATLGLTREASQLASVGDVQRAEELMDNVAFLRKLAAELLLESR